MVVSAAFTPFFFNPDSLLIFQLNQFQFVASTGSVCRVFTEDPGQGSDVNSDFLQSLQSNLS